MSTILRPNVFLTFVLAAGILCLAAPAWGAKFDGCAVKPTSPLVVNVKTKGAKGDGKADDTAAIQKAIDEVAGTGGTVYVPAGVYMVRATGKSLRLGSRMTLKLADRAILKVIPNSAKRYATLRIAKVSDVTVVGGTLLGDRKTHGGKGGEWGMGIRIGPKSKRMTISGVTAKDMWGDGFYVNGVKDIAFCSVVADHNRRQGLSIISARNLLVTNSVFKNTRGTRPSAGIDIEPDRPEQKVKDVRIENSKFVNNAGGGIMIAGKRGPVADVAIRHNTFEERRPILVENAPKVRSTAICDNRLIVRRKASAQGFDAFADPVETVSLQTDCREGRDLRFEVKRHTKKKKKKK